MSAPAAVRSAARSEPNRCRAPWRPSHRPRRAAAQLRARGSSDRSFDGGWRAFVSCVPNTTLCTDNQLARVGFMDPKAVGKFVEGLQAAGLVFLESGECTDIAVVDQERGPTIPCEWLEFAHIPFGKSGGRVAACWLFEGPRLAAGVHIPGRSTDLATPEGWTLQGWISQRFTFVPNENVGQRL